MADRGALMQGLVETLCKFPDMHDEKFRLRFLREVGRLLRLDGPFPVQNASNPRDHIVDIVDVCMDWPDSEAALRALHGAMKLLRPLMLPLVEALQDLADEYAGLTALSAAELARLLAVIAGLPVQRPDVTAHRLVAEMAAGGEQESLHGDEDLRGIVRRLNGAMLPAEQSPRTTAPFVLRFLHRFADAVPPELGARLRAEVERIAKERGVTLPDAPHDMAGTAHRDLKEKVLKVWVHEVSAPGSRPPRYTMLAKVCRMDPLESIAWKQCHEQCGGHEIEKAKGEFTELAVQLYDEAGSDTVVVEFFLPLSLLDHPVDTWSYDKNDYTVGHRFPVVVRSLDRQSMKGFYEPWRKRWDMLFGTDHGRPIGDRIGWMHDGNSAIPPGAALSCRVIDLRLKKDLIRWLAEATNETTPGLGLTFAYRPGDPVSEKAVQDAVREGMPLLVWCRGNADVQKLERLLREVTVDELKEKILSWRRSAANEEPDSREVTYQIVLMLDNPYDVALSLFTPPR